MNMAATLFRMTVEECLIGVTRNAARALGLGEEAGTLEAGKSCDLAIWDIERPAELVYRMGFNPLHARISVSYTHLDVYKRQSLDRATPSPSRSWPPKQSGWRKGSEARRQAAAARIASAFANSAGSTTRPEAAAFSVTCSGRLAPMIAEATLGSRSTQARANCERVAPAWAARGFSRSTASRVAGAIRRLICLLYTSRCV